MVFFRISDEQALNLEFVREWSDGYYDPNDTGRTLPPQPEPHPEHLKYWLTMLFDAREPITVEGEPAKHLV